GEADLCDRKVFARQQALGPIHAKPGEKIVWGFSERAGEQPMIMIRRQAGLASCVGETQGLIQTCCKVIARPAKLAEELVIAQWPEPLRRSVNQWMLHENRRPLLPPARFHEGRLQGRVGILEPLAIARAATTTKDLSRVIADGRLRRCMALVYHAYFS